MKHLKYYESLIEIPTKNIFLVKIDYINNNKTDVTLIQQIYKYTNTNTFKLNGHHLNV